MLLLASGAVALLCLPSAATAQVSFSAPTNYGVGDGPRSVALGDLDRDGDLDLAVGHGAPGPSVLLGDGAGRFGVATSFAVRSAVSVALADLNGDGRLDLASANPFAGGDLSVLLGDGMGGLGAARSLAAGVGPIGVTVGDLNRDGRADLAVADVGADGVSVLLGDGLGAFGAATGFAAGDSPRTVAVGNLDGDANPDLAVANADSNDVSVLRGDGAGRFAPATSYAVGRSPRSVVLADLNGDGHLDLVVSNADSSNVSVLLGDGSGRLGARTDFAGVHGPESVAVADLDRDRRLDLAVANSYTFPGRLSVLLGDGNGGFARTANFTVGAGPVSVAVGDVNGDGRPDLVTANFGSDDVSVLTGGPAPWFRGSGSPARVSPNGRVTLPLRIGCPPPGAPCRVSVAAMARRSADAAARRKRVKLGRSGYVVKVGRSARTRFTLTPWGRSLLRRRERIRAKVEIRVARGSGTTTKTATARLEAPRPWFR
jgi:FG-GAP-like repeat/FG-GAP repeat